MKTKAKLILAMSVLTAGVVAAGATGTFAWFTTNRAAQLTYSTVTATKNAGNLDAWIVGEATGKPSAAWESNLDANKAESSDGAKASKSITANNKVSDISSKDGVNFCKPIWKTISGNAQPVNEYQKGVRGEDYVTFFFKVTNTGNTPLQVYLNSGTGIVASSSGDTGKNTSAANYMRVAINETQEDPSKTGYALFGLPSTSKTWLIENSTGDTGHYLAYKDKGEFGPGEEKANLTVLPTDDSLVHFTSALGEVNTSNYSKMGSQMLGKLDASTGVTPTRYFTVSVWLEGTKSNDADFDNAAGGAVDINIDLTAIQVA